MNQKCPGCGLINWSDAEECKRCKAPLQPLGEADAFTSTMPVFEQEKPATVLGTLMIIWGALALTSGLYVLTFGAVTHVLVLGPAILVSGIAVVRGRQSGMALYFVGVLVMFFWLFSEGRVVLAIGSFLYAGLIGLLVTKRRLPILAGALIVFSSVAFVGAMMLPTLLRADKVAWRSFQPSHGMFSLQMPSEPNARDPKVEQKNGYVLTKHIYESRVKGQGGALYVVVEITPALPVSETSSYEKILDAELTNFLKNTNSTLVSKSQLDFHGHQGLMFEVKPPQNLALEKPRSFGRIFMNSNHLYLMNLTATESSELMNYRANFLNAVPTALSAAR